MGLIERALSTLFGSGNVIRETAEVFRENAEGAAAREVQLSEAALAQFAAEFAQQRRGWFDRFMDGVNRLPRPAMAMGTLGLFVAAMVDPIWFAARMQGIALVPEPLWWLLGAIVSFYFGARHQLKGQEFRRSIAATVAAAPVVRDNISGLRSLDGASDSRTGTGDAIARDNLQALDIPHALAAPVGPSASHVSASTTVSPAARPHNRALEDWRAGHGG